MKVRISIISSLVVLVSVFLTLVIVGCSNHDNPVVQQEEIQTLAPPKASITIISPNGFEVWDPGKNGNGTGTIKWVYNKGNVLLPLPPIKVELSRDNGNSWETLYVKIENKSPINWKITGAASPFCKIRISSVELLSVSSVSAKNFAIIGPYYNGIAGGYCTWYAAQEFDKVAPSPKKNWGGNAQDWYSNAGAAGWIVSNNPKDPRISKGTIVVWEGGTYGHVAVLNNISKDKKGIPISVDINEMNGGSDLGFRNPDGTTCAITTLFGKVSQLTRSTENATKLARSTNLPFKGYILPIRK